MKILILCLTAILVSAPAFAERTAGSVEETQANPMIGTSDAVSEAASTDVNVACKEGNCPLPKNVKPASIMDPMASKNFVEWVVNGANGKPPVIGAETTH